MAIPFATITFPEEFESTNEVFVSLKIKYRDNPGFVLSAWIHFYLKTLYALGKGLHADGLKLMLESWARHPFGQKYEIDSDLVLLENGDPYGEAYVLEVSGATFPATVITHLPKGGNKNRFAYAVVALAEAIFAGEDRKYLALSIDLIQFYHVSDKPYSKSSAIMGAYQYLLPKLVTWKFDVSAESVLSETGQTGERHEHEEKLRAEEEARKLREEEELRRQKEEEARKLREEENEARQAAEREKMSDMEATLKNLHATPRTSFKETRQKRLRLIRRVVYGSVIGTYLAFALVQNTLLPSVFRGHLTVEREALSAFESLKWVIKDQVGKNWSEPGNFSGLSVGFLVRVDREGNVLWVKMTRSSGNARLDESAENAIFKASPLPFPDEERFYEYLKEFNFLFKPES